MNLKSKLAVTALLIGSAAVAQATTYNVSATFTDGGIQGQTMFSGSFDWDGTSVTNFTGMLSESMWSWNSANNRFENMGGMGDMGHTGKVSNVGTAAHGDAPLLHLTNQLDNSSLNSAGTLAAGQHAVSVFLNDNGMAGTPDTNVVNGDALGSGGYDIAAPTWGSLKYGTTGGATPNENAFFTLVFDETDPTNTTATMAAMQYGDCTALGLMGPMLTGSTCMTGFNDGTNAGSMGGSPISLNISQVAAVPVPAAVWLFGGALMSLFGANRRKNVLPA